MNGGLLHQDYYNVSGAFNVYSGGKLQVDAGTVQIGSNTSTGYADLYIQDPRETVRSKHALGPFRRHGSRWGRIGWCR